MKKMIDRVEEETKNNKGMILNIAFNYGAKEEIVDTINRLIESKKKVTKKSISDNLWNTDLDLVIRSGGEQRLSNFFIWETAYSELLFVKKYWPAFTEKDFEKAIEWYDSRSRRFGK
jgi:undecaprenyl diphosphate synthase